MPINNSGELSFFWPSVQDAEYYKVRFYKNNSYSFIASTSETGYQVTGLSEGNSVSGDVYHIIDDQPSIDKYSLPTQYFDVFNFHDLNKSLVFSGMSLNGIPLNLSSISNITTASGISFNKQSTINVLIQNPRDNLNINYFEEEPFLTGIKYRSVYLLSDNVDYTQVDNFTFSSENPGSTSRSYITEIIAEDYYGSGITGNINIYNQPIELQSLNISKTAKDTGLLNDFSLTYTTDAEYVDYSFYDNPYITGTPFLTGRSNDPYEFSVTLPLGTTGYLELVPYDWFGSGIKYSEPNYFYSESTDLSTITYNTFNSINVSHDSDFGFAEVLASYSDTSESGSFIYLSVDSGNSSSFDGNSLLTGELYSSSGYSFNYFDHLNENHFEIIGQNVKTQPFFFNFKLIQSGTHNLEAESQIQFNARVPSIENANIAFDYDNGITSLNFITEPFYTYTGVDVLISGSNNSSYQLYSGSGFSDSNLDYYADIQLVHSQNHNFIFDSSFVSGSGVMPSVSFSLANFSPIENIASFSLTNETTAPINQILCYGKYSLESIESSGYIGDNLSGFLNFNDYPNHQLQDVSLNLNSFPAPTGIHANQIYPSTGIGFTGAYESGTHFMYRFVPYNGYGAGHVTDAIPYEFFLNASTQEQQESIEDLNEKVNELNNAKVSMYSDSVNIPSGNYSLTVDYSVAGFTDIPHVVGILSTNNNDDPILGLILSGDPTTTSSTFILSDQVDSTGYKLKYIASEDII